AFRAPFAGVTAADQVLSVEPAFEREAAVARIQGELQVGAVHFHVQYRDRVFIQRDGGSVDPVELLPDAQDEIAVAGRLHAPQPVNLCGDRPHEDVATFHDLVVLGGPFIHVEGVSND